MHSNQRAWKRGASRAAPVAALLVCAICVSPSPASFTSTQLASLERIGGEYDAFVVTDDLEAPRGLSIHPLTGDLYVTEGDEGQVSVIREGRPVPVLRDNWSVKDELPIWAISDEKPRESWLRPVLRHPEALAFSGEGHLYVVEHAADGRLLEFVPEADGSFLRATVIPIPWFYKGFAWKSLAVSADGRLFVAGSAVEAGPGLHFGVVLMRDNDGNWWVIDYGPFAGFCSVSLSRGQDILVVGESVNGTLTWWDTLRHRAIGTVAKLFPELDHACVLPDGAIVVAQERPERQVRMLGEKTADGGQLYRVNPQNGKVRAIASGFGTIREMCVSRKNGFIYVTEEDSGLLLELRPRKPVAEGTYLLENTVRLSEIAAGLPPKKWPPFLKGFFKDLGVTPRDEIVREAEQGQSFSGPNTYTLVEVGDAIPLIAGKVKTHPAHHGPGVDPIAEIDFLVLFPNHAFSTREDTSPGYAFFSAKKESGTVERTYSLEHMKAITYTRLHGWKTYAKRATVLLPTATCAVRSTDDGMDIDLSFVSLHGGDDYYLRLECGEENTGHLLVDSGDRSQMSYGIDFTEETLDGAAYNTLVVAGFSSKETDRPGWLNIGNWPMDYSISPEPSLPWMPYSASDSHPMLEALWQTQRPRAPDPE